MPIIQCYVDDVTLRRLEHAASTSLRKVDELASCAIEEAALEYAKTHGILVLVGNGETKDVYK